MYLKFIFLRIAFNKFVKKIIFNINIYLKMKMKIYILQYLIDVCMTNQNKDELLK